MSTLISVLHSDGTGGRCDEKCYNATGPVCNCVCGGKNHGAGEKQATANTTEMAAQMIDDYKRDHGPDAVGAKFSVNPEIYQLKLF